MSKLPLGIFLVAAGAAPGFAQPTPWFRTNDPYGGNITSVVAGSGDTVRVAHSNNEGHMIKPLAGGLLLIAALGSLASAQEQNTFRVFTITLQTSAPAQLAIDRGRLIWRDTDVNSGNLLFKYYWGQGIANLDSGLSGLTCAISGDHIVWNTSGASVKSFDCRTWVTSQLGSSYNPDFAQPVAVAGDIAAYARRNQGTGTSIDIHRYSTSTDTLLSEGIWNTWPSVHHGEAAWVVSDSESETASSNIYFFDGRSARNLSGTAGVSNRAPLLRDGQCAWVSAGAGSKGVKLFTGDSVITIAQRSGGTVVVAGYDLSDGIAVAALRDTAGGASTLRIYDAATGGTTTLSDSSGAYAPHISNGLVIWQSGSGPGRRLRTYSIQGSLTQDIAGAENPVIDHDLLAWTYGDAVEMRRPVTYTQLTTDGQNGWEQTKFKTIDSGRVVWGNFANSTHSRLFFADGSSTRELADSAVTHDLIMSNSGYVVWRSNFDSMYYCDGLHDPVKFVDTVQAENPYVAGGFISFSGLRIAENRNIKHAWLYDIGGARLTQLTTDTTNCANVMCEGKTACWLNTDTGRLMFFDGITSFPLSDSLVDSKYSYRNGRVVWCERRSGIMQAMMYTVVSKTKTTLSTGSPDKSSPLTDGQIVAWYENPIPAGTTVSADMRYYDIASGASVLVPRATYFTTTWNWLSGGGIAWSANGNIYQFDGSVVSQITGDDFNVNTGVYLDRGTLVWQRTPPPPTGMNGQIFTGKLRPHPAFDAAGVTGPAPLGVSFVNRSWEGAQTVSWDFGDGGRSNAPNPSHVYAGPGAYSVTLTVTGPTGSVQERKYHLVHALSATSAALTPETMTPQFALSRNYPNPFNPATSIGYRIGAASRVSLAVYDMLGRNVATLVDAVQGAGSYTVTWDGSQNASGVYICRLKAGGYMLTRKMTLIK